MKRNLLISLIISFITVLGLNFSAQADTTITRVTSNSWEDSFPQIKGNYVVWQRYVNSHWQIFLYDIENKKATPITNYNYDSISPRTDGQYVVWFGACNQGGEIFLYNINSRKTIRITNDSNVDSPPQIANGRVVWTSHQVTDSVEPGEIYLYDIVTKYIQRLTNNNLDDGSPRINSEAVIWVQIDENGDDTLYIYNDANGTTVAPEDFIWEDSPQTDGDLTVSMRNDGHNWEIIIRKDGQNGFEQVTNTSVDNRYPSISGDYMTWMAGEGSASEIYIAKYDAPAAAGCKGDLNGDGVVDMRDWLEFGKGWGRTNCKAAGAQPCGCDLNNDGTCDMQDWLLFGEDYGRTDCGQ
jgi:beta propeller repeat protein